MSFEQAFASIEQHVKAFAESAAEKVEQDLPVLSDFVQKAATNPVMIAIANAVHLPESPEMLQVLADTITKADAAIGAAKAAGAAEAQAAAAAQPAQ